MSEVQYTTISDLEDDEGFIEESGELIPSEENESFHYDPVVTTPAYHVEQAEKALEKLKSVVEKPGWKKALTVKNTVVYTKNGIGDNDNKAPVFMCQHVIDKFSPQSIFAVIGMRKLWDPWYEEGNLIENLNDSTSLTYMVMQGVAGTRIRDLSLVEKIQCTQDGTIYFASTSVEKVPHVVDRIRAYIHLNGWIIKPISYNPPITKVTYVLQAKVNGWVPSVVAKKYLTKRPLVVLIIDQYLQKNGPPPMVISTSPTSPTSPTSSGRQSRSESNASFYNHIDMAEQRHRFKRENIIIKDKNESQRKMILDSPSPNNRKEISFYLDNESNDSSKRVLDPPSQNNRKEISFSLEDESDHSSQSFKKDLHRKKTLDPPSQNNKREISSNLDDESDHSSTSEAHKQYSSSKSSPLPKQNHFPSSLDQETIPIQSVMNLPSPPLSSPSSPPSPPPPVNHQHTDAVNAAVTTFKDNIKSLEGWNFYSENKGVKIYTKDVGRSTPIIRGDYTLFGSYTADDLLSVIKNLDLRKLWDDRYDDGENIKLFDNDNILSRVAVKGTFPISGRDFALCGTVERDPKTSALYFVTTSITDPAIPEFKKYVRAHIHFTGWQITPRFDVNENIKSLSIIYVVDTDIKLESIPQSILKSISAGTPMVIQKIDEMMQKIGFPPYIINSSSLLISESLNPKTFQYNLTYAIKDDGITEIRYSKQMYPNGFDILVTPKSAKVELLPNDQGIVRITPPSEVSTDEIQIQITKYTNGFKMTYNEKNSISLVQKKEPGSNVDSVKSAQPIAQSVELPIKQETVQRYQNLRHSRNISVDSISKNNKYNEQGSIASLRQLRHSRNLSNPIHINSIDVDNFVKRDNKYNEQDSLVSCMQRHSKRASQLIDPNATLVVDGIVDKNKNNEQEPRKTKRLSFADSPSIINPDTFSKPEEENDIPEYDENNEYNEYKEYEEIIKTFNENSIEQLQTYDFHEDIFVISDNVKFNTYQVAIMFVGMVISYYSGRFSCYFS